jgi:hypothetical protein
MLWPIVLPFQITSLVLLALIVLATLAAPLLKWRRLPTFVGVLVFSLIAFIPSCVGIMNVVDSRRFGVYNYQTFNEVKDFRVERYLPSAARDITVDKYAQGFRARFTITQAELDAYMDEVWNSYGKWSVVKRGEMSAMALIDRQSHELRFGDLGWDYLDDATEIYGPTAGNGAGFSIWYSPSKRVAYERGGYW